jgi:hypothetical protein
MDKRERETQDKKRKEEHRSEYVLVCLTPHSLRLRLHAGDTIEHSHGSVKDSE